MYKYSKRQKAEYAKQLKQIEAFCSENGIRQSAKGDGYYFNVNGVNYRVSNHSIEASNQAAYCDGEQVRELYHADGRNSDTVYIHASKLRIIEIYNNIKQGLKLDGCGRIIG